MHRFFVETSLPAHGVVTLPPDLARQVARVLRLRVGEDVVLFDGSGDDVITRLSTVSEKRVEAEVVSRAPNVVEPHVHLTLFQALLKGERFEWVLQKGTELGVASFAPLLSQRVVREGGNIETTRYPRWRRILREAAEQCGRARVPDLAPPVQIADAPSRAKGVVVMPWEEARSGSLHEALSAPQARAEGVTLLIGPEGGFDPAEARHAEAAGARIVTLGRRVLRSETAGVVAAALVLHELGEMA